MAVCLSLHSKQDASIDRSIRQPVIGDSHFGNPLRAFGFA
jgi:hypothetical protein